MTSNIEAQRRVNSPEVHPNQTVTFRFYAPKADKVSLRSNRKDLNGGLEKSTDGIWSITLGPIEPGIYPYRFDVDGAIVLDPSNRHVKAWLTMDNLVEVPPALDKGQNPLPFQVQDIPHGAVHMRWYHSPRLNQQRRLLVYTPPGYKESKTKFPVLYLLHGFGDDESAWTAVGKANHIADYLIHLEKAKPMVIVMPFGHNVLPGSSDFAKYEILQNLIDVEQELVEGVLPFIEQEYRVLDDPESRAIAGLSMGGGQAFHIGAKHLNKFRWIIGFSSSFKKQQVQKTFEEHLDDIKTQNPFLWLGCGKSDFLFEDTTELDKWLNEKKIRHTTAITEGAHNWYCWRAYLEEVIPELFRLQQ